jgi:hypothetical protein
VAEQQQLVPIAEVIQVNGTVLVGWALDAEAEALVVVCQKELDAEVKRDWAGRPALSSGNAARLLARLRGQADPGSRPDPVGAASRPGLVGRWLNSLPGS